MTGKEMWDMKLHETLLVENGAGFSTETMRVPGGWLYTYYNDDVVTSTFVPLNNEFMEATNETK